MAKSLTCAPITADDVPNALAFLSWNVPIADAEPTTEAREEIECGRMAILDACRFALTANQD